MGGAERLEGAQVSPNLFPLMGVRPILGRTFVESEGVQGNEHVVILGFGLWQRRFSGDPPSSANGYDRPASRTRSLASCRVASRFPNGQAWVPFVPDERRAWQPRLCRRHWPAQARRHRPSWRSATSMSIMERLARDIPADNEGGGPR